MGLIKTAIMTGGGIYAVDKLAKTVQNNNNNQNHHCACCSRNLGNQQSPQQNVSRGGSPSQSQQQSQQGYLGPPPTQENMVWYPYAPDSQGQVQQARSMGNKTWPAQGQGEWEQHPYYRDENALRGTSSENLPAYGNGGAQKTGYAAEK